MKINLPNEDGGSEAYTLHGRTPAMPEAARALQPRRLCRRPCGSRSVFRTATRQARPPSTGTGRCRSARHLLDLGFGIAEAMDTSQRGMGLDWPKALELIGHSLKSAGKRADMIYSGCGTDQLPAAEARIARRCDPRLSRSVAGDPEARRTHHPDGEPGAGESGEVAR